MLPKVGMATLMLWFVIGIYVIKGKSPLFYIKLLSFKVDQSLSKVLVKKYCIVYLKRRKHICVNVKT